MAVSRLIGCNVYISEGRNLRFISRAKGLCQRYPQVVLANAFVDAPYNRTGLTLLATSVHELTSTILSVAQHTLSHLDLRQHAADHPRLGVLDHISLHPLGEEATLHMAAEAARSVGQQLAAPPLQLPVYYYGAAHPGGRCLAEGRRNIGYFRMSTASHNPNNIISNSGTSSGSSSSDSSYTSSSHWSGSLNQLQLSHYPPCDGPAAASAAAGVVTIGAVPWVVNYNVPLHTTDMVAAKAVARAVSTRGGGLLGVEAMALPHGPGIIEIATNLTAYDWRKQSDSSNTQLGPGLQQDESSSLDLSVSAVHASAGLNGHRSAMKRQQKSCAGIIQLTGAGPVEVRGAVAAAAQLHGLPAPGQGYITNKLPPQLLAIAGGQLNQ